MSKIYIIPVEVAFQPKKMGFHAPAHNSFYTIEEDFLIYLKKHPEMLTNNPKEARFHYLPVFWTYWLVNHNYGRRDLHQLQNEVNRCIIDDCKTFTICRYADGPVVKTGEMIQFLASRKTSVGKDVPNVCSPHKIPSIPPAKKYLTSFAGSLKTNAIRQRMAENLKGNKDILVVNRGKGTEFFVRTMLESYIALSPRGYGGSSFRFYEAMQLGVVPFLIGDIDHRPFKKHIDWDKISLYAYDEKGLEEKLRSINKEELLEMGKRAAKVWKEDLDMQKWCKYVLKELGI